MSKAISLTKAQIKRTLRVCKLMQHSEVKRCALVLNHLAEIETLNEKVLKFYANLMNATTEEGRLIESEKRELISKIGYKIIGVPFSNHDAELYALDRKIEYTVLELNNG